MMALTADTGEILRSLLCAQDNSPSMSDNNFTTESALFQDHGAVVDANDDIYLYVHQDHSIARDNSQSSPLTLTETAVNAVVNLKSDIDIGDYELIKTEVDEDQNSACDTVLPVDSSSVVLGSSILERDKCQSLVTVKELEDESSSLDATAIYQPSNEILEENNSFYFQQRDSWNDGDHYYSVFNNSESASEGTNISSQISSKTCQSCGKTLGNQYSFHRHSQFYCPNQKRFNLLCKVCGIMVSSTETLRIHVINQHGDDIWENLKYHIKEAAVEIENVSISKYVSHAVEFPLRNHNVKASCTLPVSVTQSGFNVASGLENATVDTLYDDHYLEENQISLPADLPKSKSSAEMDPLSESLIKQYPKRKCKFCSKSFTLQGLRRHSKFHCQFQKKYIFRCKVCGITVSSHDTLRSHINIRHGEDFWERYKYHIDQVTFAKTRKSENVSRSSNQPLTKPKVQLNCHNVTSSFEESESRINSSKTCKFCNKVFSNFSISEKHRIFHCPYQKKYRLSCKVCGALSSSRSQFGLHIRSKHGEYMWTKLKGNLKNVTSENGYVLISESIFLPAVSSIENQKENLNRSSPSFSRSGTPSDATYSSEKGMVLDDYVSEQNVCRINSSFVLGSSSETHEKSEKKGNVLSQKGVFLTSSKDVLLQSDFSNGNSVSDNDIDISTMSKTKSSNTLSVVDGNSDLQTSDNKSVVSSSTLKSRKKLGENKIIASCGVCKKNYKKVSDLERHYLKLRRHKKTNIVCTKCNDMFNSLTEFKNHMEKISWKYICRIKENSNFSECPTNELEIAHHSSNSKNDTNLNFHPNNSTLNLSAMVSKSGRKLGENKFMGICGTCKRDFDFLRFLERHFTKWPHKQPCVICVKCEQMFNSVDEFKNHLVKNGLKYVCGAKATSSFTEFVKSLVENKT